MFDGNVTLPNVPVIPSGDDWYLVIGSDRNFDLAGFHLLDADGGVVTIRSGLPESVW
jgi:hypothetical protein